MHSARAIGSALLAVPLVTTVGLLLFPNYDARSRYFAGTYPNIVAAGNEFLVALVSFLAVAGLLVFLAAGLARSPLRTEASFLAVIGGLGVSVLGFTTAALTGLPVWNWARHVAEGSESLAAMASRSESLGSISQTVLLMFGLGGLLVAMSVLGVVAFLRGWTPRLAFLATVAAVVAAIVWGVVVSGPVFWLALGALPMLWAFVFGLVLIRRGRFGTPAE